MKVKHYNEMMAHLIRPGFNGGGSVSNNTVLPKRKPAAEVKKRKKINYEKIKQYLGKESQDLVERELGFAIGGGVSPNQLKQRFMEIITSIQEAEAEEVPMLVAEAKDLKDKIDELNKLLSPERQIQITSQGLDFDNPLIDAAKIQQSVKPIQDIVPKSLTTENPMLKGVTPNFPEGDKGTLADPEEKEDVFKREPGKRIATKPNNTFTKAGMQMPPRSTDLRDMIRDALKKSDEVTSNDGFADGGRIGFKKGTPFPITDEKLAKIDELIKDTDLDLKSIGKKIGYGTDKTQLKIDSPVMKAYIEKYNKPKPGRLKPANLAKDPEYVQFVIDKVKELGSKNAASKELKIERKTINNILKQKAPDLMKPENIDKGGKYNYQKVRAKTIKEMEKVLKKMPGGKTTLDQTISLMDKINTQNKTIASMTDKEILGNKKLIDSMRLDVTELKTSKPMLKFDRYKDFTDEQLVKKIRDLAKTNELFQVEHQIPVSSKRTASLFPKNIQVAVGRVGGQVETLKNFVINNPNSPIVNDIDIFLKNQNVQIKGAVGQNIGYANDIIFDSKTNTSNIVDEGIDIFRRPDNIGLGMNRINPELLDFRKLPDDVKDVGNVIRNLIKTPGGKRIARNIIKGGKFTGLGLAGELAFAAPFVADDYASGLSKERIIGNAFLASLTGIGQSEDEEIRKAVGERGYATQTLTDLSQKLPVIEDQLDRFNDQNDPTGAQREKFTKIFNNVVKQYDQAYDLFVSDAGVFDKELYNQGVNNYAAGLGQIEKFRAAKEKERGVKEASKNVTGFELDLNFAGGGLAKGAGDESGPPPESGPTPQGLASIIKRGRKY